MNRKKKGMKKRILAWVLASGMVLSAFSTNGIADVLAGESISIDKEGNTFGENNKFTYTISNKKLTITGEGVMPDFDKADAPWTDELKLSADNNNSITTIEIGEGITSIGKNTFYVEDSSNNSNENTTSETSTSGSTASAGNNTVTTVILPQSLTKIATKAFANLKSLNTIVIPSFNITVEGNDSENAFAGCKNPTEYYYLGTGEASVNLGALSFSGEADKTIVLTKNYTDSEGNTEQDSAQQDRYLPASIAAGTSYADGDFDVAKLSFPSSEKDKGYDWYNNSEMSGEVFANSNKKATISSSLTLYGKKISATPTPTATETPTATPAETATPTSTATPAETATPTSTATPAETATPTSTATTAPTASASSTPDPVVIKQQPDIGTVSCEGTVHPTTSYSKVELKRTNETVPGTLKLKETDFSKSGSNQCDYIFTPTDSAKYSEVTGKVWVNVEKDTLQSIEATGSLKKGTYKYGEKFDISGLTVKATFVSGKTKDVTNFVKATDITMSTTSVDLSYTFDGVKKKITLTGFKVEKGDIPAGEPFDKQVTNDIKTVSMATTAVLGSGSKWKFDSTKLSAVIPAGGSLEVTVTYTGSDASNYATISKIVKISRDACVEDSKIVYTGAGEKAPTCTTSGIGHTVCSKCGDTMRTGVVVEALGHNLQYVAAKAATCEEKGNDAYYLCKNCGKTYVDSAGKTETTVKEYPALGHDYTGQTPTYKWSSDHKTCVASITCKVCNKQVTETAESVCTVLESATCQKEGEALYMADFKNKAFSVQFDYGKLPKVSHYLVKIPRVEPTETEPGSIEYYECSMCKKIYYDYAGTREITDRSSIVIPIKDATPTPTPTPTESANPGESEKPVESAAPSVQPTPKAKGTNIRDTSGVTYKVVNSNLKNASVEYKKPTALVGGNIKIKDTVKIGGVTYKITTIASSTFKNNKKIVSVTVGNNVTSIGKSAFEKCIKLKSITLGKKVTKIDINAFKGCTKLKTISIKSTKLQSKYIKKGAFSGISKNVTVKVPKQKYTLYKKLLRTKGLNKNVKIKKI